MTMTPRLRKFALTVHIAVAVGWVGAVVTYITLVIAGLSSQDAQTVRATYLAMELIVKYVVVPMAFASLLTGIVQSLGTTWGLFRHYWVLISLLLTLIATLVLLTQLEPISFMAGVAAETESADSLRGGLLAPLLHPVGGLLMLLVILVLNMYKPQGVTPYGWRKQRERRAGENPTPRPGFPTNQSSGTGRGTQVEGTVNESD